MTDHCYAYVECNGCSAEARKTCGYSFGSREAQPDGWIEVDNRDREKLWDLCPECAKAFTTWLLERAGIATKTKEAP